MGRRGSRLRRVLVLLALVAAGVYVWRRSAGRTEPDLASAPAWPPLETPPVPAPAVSVAPAPAAAAAAPATWVAPEGGACPDGYPVKAARSGVFHVPGGMFYERTAPDRCYITAAAAEADGYRASKR